MLLALTNKVSIVKKTRTQVSMLKEFTEKLIQKLKELIEKLIKKMMELTSQINAMYI